MRRRSLRGTVQFSNLIWEASAGSRARAQGAAAPLISLPSGAAHGEHVNIINITMFLSVCVSLSVCMCVFVYCSAVMLFV